MPFHHTGGWVNASVKRTKGKNLRRYIDGKTSRWLLFCMQNSHTPKGAKRGQAERITPLPAKPFSVELLAVAERTSLRSQGLIAEASHVSNLFTDGAGFHTSALPWNTHSRKGPVYSCTNNGASKLMTPHPNGQHCKQLSSFSPSVQMKEVTGSGGLRMSRFSSSSNTIAEN